MKGKDIREASVILRDVATGYVARKERKIIGKHLDGELYQGELTSLLGPNGAGKSTLLRTLAAFQQPLEGEILVEGRKLSSMSSGEVAKTISVVLTDPIAVENMTVREMVGLGRTPYTGYFGQLTTRDYEIVDASLSAVGMTDYGLRKMSTLSDGEKQKIMIAKALAQETPILYLDEPTSFLDYPSKIDMMRLLRRLAIKEKRTIFLSTHDLPLALEISDRIWLLDSKLGLTCGKPADLSEEIGMYFNREGAVYDPATFRFSIKTMD